VQVQQIDLNDEIIKVLAVNWQMLLTVEKIRHIHIDSQPKQLKASSPPLAIQFIKKDLIGKII
jgi:hypothetical protein